MVLPPVTAMLKEVNPPPPAPPTFAPVPFEAPEPPPPQTLMTQFDAPAGTVSVADVPDEYVCVTGTNPPPIANNTLSMPLITTTPLR